MGCRVAADTKLETPEGPLTVRTVGASPTPVMVLVADRVKRFAMSTEVRVVGSGEPVLRLVLDNGRTLRVGAEQTLLAVDGTPRRAGDLGAGDRLLSAFAFPPGYAFRTDAGEACVSDGGVGIANIAADGVADVYDLTAPGADRIVFSAGVVGLTGT